MQFNRELQIGDKEVYTKIISTLVQRGVINNYYPLSGQDIEEMAKNIYNTSEDKLAEVSETIQLFLNEYREKIFRDISLFKNGTTVSFNIRIRRRQ